MVGLGMVALLGFTAITVDIGAMYAERAQLQSAADAAAIAIAQECAAGGDCTETATEVIAQAFADANVNDEAANASTPTFPEPFSVEVTTTTKDAHTGAGTLGLVFAPLLGIEAPTVSATATAGWGSPRRGPAVLPLAFAPCSFDLDGGIQVLRIHGNNDGSSCSSTSPSGQVLPGGFGWLDDPSGTCNALVGVGDLAPSGTGVSLPSNCAQVLADHKDETVLVPVYDDTGGSGSGAWYRIRGWAAFTLLGWNFPGYSYNNQTYSGAQCNGNCKGLIGKFESYVSLDDRFIPGGPDLGASLVRLTK